MSKAYRISNREDIKNMICEVDKELNRLNDDSNTWIKEQDKLVYTVLEAELSYSKIHIENSWLMEDGRELFQLADNDDASNIGYLCVALSDFGQKYNLTDYNTMSSGFGDKLLSFKENKYVFLGFGADPNMGFYDNARHECPIMEWKCKKAATKVDVTEDVPVDTIKYDFNNRRDIGKFIVDLDNAYNGKHDVLDDLRKLLKDSNAKCDHVITYNDGRTLASLVYISDDSTDGNPITIVSWLMIGLSETSRGYNRVDYSEEPLGVMYAYCEYRYIYVTVSLNDDGVRKLFPDRIPGILDIRGDRSRPFDYKQVYCVVVIDNDTSDIVNLTVTNTLESAINIMRQYTTGNVSVNLYKKTIQY